MRACSGLTIGAPQAQSYPVLVTAPTCCHWYASDAVGGVSASTPAQPDHLAVHANAEAPTSERRTPLLHRVLQSR